MKFGLGRYVPTIPEGIYLQIGSKRCTFEMSTIHNSSNLGCYAYGELQETIVRSLVMLKIGSRKGMLKF